MSIRRSHGKLRHLGEQAEVEIIKKVISNGLFVPLKSVEGYDGRSGTVWILQDGRLARRSGSRSLVRSPMIRALSSHDEPTAALDSQRAGAVTDLLRKVATERGTAVIVVTHDEKIFNRFDHIYSLRDGALEAPQSQAA